MARTFKLNDLQLILLSSAAQRADGSLLPPPASITEPAGRIRKVVPPLLKQALVDEVDVTSTEQTWRSEGERQIGLVINDAGRTAIGIALPEEAGELSPESEPATAPDTCAQPGSDEAAMPIAEPAPRTSKIAMVVELLQREEGATLDELVAATRWLPHTTRAALTGLRKKGHAIRKAKRSDVTCYHLAGEA